MPIPKKIHYFWADGIPIPKTFANYIQGWQKLNPDFEIRRWTEKDIDIKKYPLVAKAINERRWALAADIVRMFAIYEEGGFYLDTDMELLKPLDDFCSYDAVAAWESNYWFTTAFFGAKKHSPWIKKILKRYELANPDQKITTDTFLKTVHCTSVYAKDFFEFNDNGETQFDEKNNFAVFAPDYFCPKHYMTGDVKKTKNTTAFHHYASTWHTKIEKIKNRLAIFAYRLLGVKVFSRFERMYHKKLEREIRKELP